MKLFELFATEAPLPQDWNKDVFSSRSSFTKMLKYAAAMSKKIGTGSSRVAFEIEYEGRPTILKIARNPKGLAQNEYESGLLFDHYLKNLGIVIPGIDYDEGNDPPRWIHTEKATKCKPTEFKKYWEGLTPVQLVRVVEQMVGKKQPHDDEEQRLVDHFWNEEDSKVKDFAEFIGNYDIAPGDFTRLANWGIYNGHVVIIDVGGSSQIIQKLYLKR